MGGQSRRNDAETHGKQHQKADMRQRQITYKIEQAHNTQTCKQACRHKTSTQTEIWRVQIEEIEIEANKDVLIDRSNQRRSRRNEDLDYSKKHREEEQKTGNSHTNKQQADRAINREEDSQMKNRQPDIDKMTKYRHTKHRSRKKHTKQHTGKHKDRWQKK